MRITWENTISLNFWQINNKGRSCSYLLCWPSVKMPATASNATIESKIGFFIPSPPFISVSIPNGKWDKDENRISLY